MSKAIKGLPANYRNSSPVSFYYAYSVESSYKLGEKDAISSKKPCFRGHLRLFSDLIGLCLGRCRTQDNRLYRLATDVVARPRECDTDTPCRPGRFATGDVLQDLRAGIGRC